MGKGVRMTVDNSLGGSLQLRFLGTVFWSRIYVEIMILVSRSSRILSYGTALSYTHVRRGSFVLNIYC